MYKELNEILENTEAHFKEFSLKKIKNGQIKTRDIKQPINTLKVIHKKLARLLSRVETPAFLQSKKGSSYKDNALKHLGHDYVITLDIKDYFPSCRRERVAKSFYHHFGMSGDIAYLVSKLLTFNGIVPQGSNTSSLIAFWSNFSMFCEIDDYCKEHGLTFTLFVDDITVSSHNAIPYLHYKKILSILIKNGFQVQHSKTKWFKKGQIKHITGVAVLADRIEIEHKKKKDFFQHLEENKTDSKSMLSLSGRYNSLKYIDSNFCPSFSSRLKSQNYSKKALKKARRETPA